MFVKNINYKCRIDDTSIESDHALIECTIRITDNFIDKNQKEKFRDSLKPIKKQINNIKLVNKLNCAIMKNYNRIIINQQSTTNQEESLAQSIKKAYHETFKSNTMLHKQKYDKSNIIPNDLKILINTRRRLKTAYTKYRSPDMQEKLREIKISIKTRIIELKKILME